MNIVEDIARFYDKSEKEITKSLELTNVDCVIFCLKKDGSVAISSVKKETKYKLVDCFENIKGDINLDLFKTAVISSRHLFDNTDNCIFGNDSKKIASIIPNVFSFVNKKNCFSACEYDSHVTFSFSINENNKWKPTFKKSPMITGSTQSQSQKKYYHPSGVINCLYVRSLSKNIKSK